MEVFTWVSASEVAEHLPASAADGLVGYLTAGGSWPPSRGGNLIEREMLSSTRRSESVRVGLRPLA